jgi:alanine dehydrogenase
MKNTTTIGFPRMKKEAGERRVFLPEFIQSLANQGAEVSLEEGYGSRSGFTLDDYEQGNPNVHMCDRAETFKKDFVIVLRSPLLDEFHLLGAHSCLISMLHFPTRPKRVRLLKELGARAISMDCIVNDRNIRLMEDMKAVAWNGLEVAFDLLEKRIPNLSKADGTPFQVLVIGTGMVGKHAVDAATKLGNIERNNDHLQAGGMGSLAISVGRNLTNRTEIMQGLIQKSDVLVDAAQRRDPSHPVVPNDWLAWLPEHAVVTDLSVDPYTMDVDPPVVRGVEGIPQGNLDQYIFEPEDSHWMDTIPASIPSTDRRTTVSCYSWPGIHPEASMLHYASQLEPLMSVLLAKGYDHLSLDGDYFERALYRAAINSW